MIHSQAAVIAFQVLFGWAAVYLVGGLGWFAFQKRWAVPLLYFSASALTINSLVLVAFVMVDAHQRGVI